jgi:MerR family transcriptional regulator, thiopeptide resistance regulator
MVYGDLMTHMTVGDLAQLSGVTVRTLHHYDDIGLLPASGRTPSGYRTYSEADVDRLRAILTYRELGLGLDEVARAISSEADSVATLRAARKRLRRRIARLRDIADALDEAIAVETRGETMTPEEKLAVFGDFDPSEHEAEAEDRWGDTDAYRQSRIRTDSYTKADWVEVQAEASEIYQRFLALKDAGVDPASAEARAVVDAHRRHISDRFYDCSEEIHAGLGQMYVADVRFTANIDRSGEGLAAYMSAAIAAAYA